VVVAPPAAALVPPRQGVWGAPERQDQLRRQVQVSEGQPGQRRHPDQLDKSPARTTWRVNQELRNRHRALQGQPGRQALPQAVRRGWLLATATLPRRRQEPDQLGPPELLMVWHQGRKAPIRIIPQPSQEQLEATLVSHSTELRL
jgi:hypothetical protein